MDKKLRFCICGGGSEAHAVAGILGANKRHSVNILTRRPAEWDSKIRVFYKDELELNGCLNIVSDKPEEVIPEAHVVILAVPSDARSEVLTKIAPHLSESAWVGCFPGFGGFEWVARKILGEQMRLFGSQRVPYVCKKLEYGKTVLVTGIRAQLFLAALPAKLVPEISEIIENALNMRVIPMGNYLTVSLSLSNPTFLPARLYSLFNDWSEGETFDRKILFYDEWDDSASYAFGEFDREIQNICRKLSLDLAYVKPIVQHYEIPSLDYLTSKIRNIKALQGRFAPLKETADGFVPDFNTSYFTEDIPFGLVVIRSIAEVAGVETPMMDEVIKMDERLRHKKYLVSGKLTGEDTTGLPIARNFGIDTVDKLVERATEKNNNFPKI